MAPRRTTRSTADQETVNATTVTNAQLQAMIDQGVTAALAARDALRSTNGDDNHNSGTGSMHILNDPSFFLTNKTVAPQGEELGLMMPLSESSCSCLDKSFISDGANRYGARATRAAPGIKSIGNSTGRPGGRPGKSSGNTSRKSRTIGTSLSCFPSDLSSFFWRISMPKRSDILSPCTLELLNMR
nr:hypothetical protein [Tanacetum cinerariifolium]